MAMTRDPRAVRDDPFDRPPNPWDVSNFREPAKPAADRLLREIAHHHEIKLTLLGWDSLRGRIEHHMALALREQAMGLHKVRD